MVCGKKSCLLLLLERISIDKPYFFKFWWTTIMPNFSLFFPTIVYAYSYHLYLYAPTHCNSILYHISFLSPCTLATWHRRAHYCHVA